MWSEIKSAPRKAMAGEKKFKVPASLHDSSRAAGKKVK
jgi:hypothetical protein